MKRLEFNRQMTERGVDIYMPLVDYFHHTEKTTKLFDLHLAEPPPPPPPAPRRKPKQEVTREIPKPKLAIPRRLMPLRPSLSLDLALGDVTGDFKMNYQIPCIRRGPA